MCQVEILTSQEHHREVEKPWGQTYREFWRTKISSDQEPPATRIVIVGTKSGKLPIHDRWWLTKAAGLRMGPFAHLGITRTSEISHLNPDKVEALKEEVEQYLRLIAIEYDNQRLKYDAFTL